MKKLTLKLGLDMKILTRQKLLKIITHSFH